MRKKRGSALATSTSTISVLAAMAEPEQRGVQRGDYNEQYNYFAPVTRNLFVGSAERLRDVCFDPAPLVRDLDLAHFTGREWLIEQIDRFVQRRPRGYVIVQGEAGVGKSALAAHLVGTRPWLHHFTRLAGGRSPETARKSLSAQLIARWNLIDDWAPAGVLPASAARPDWFDRLLHGAARQRDHSEPDVPIVLVIDGLDEAQEAADSRLPLGLPESLPDRVFILATSRFGVDRSLHAIRNPADWLTIEVDGPDNLADMRQFINEVTSADRGDPQILAALRNAGIDMNWFRVKLAESCSGVWIYLRYVLDEIRDGTREPTSIDRLPADLAGYYAEQIQRWRHPRGQRANGEIWEKVRLPLLGALAVARAPLAVSELMSFAGVSSLPDAREFFDEAARAFLNRGTTVSGEQGYALRHQSLRDLLSGTVNTTRPDIASLLAEFADETRRAHERIVTALTPDGLPGERAWERSAPYARGHLAAHAAACGALDDLVCDPGYLLTAEPGSVLTERGALTTIDGQRAVGAYELSLTDWQVSPAAVRATRLDANAARLHAHALSRACMRLPMGDWRLRWASWSGRSHQVLVHSEAVYAVAIGRAGDTDIVVTGSVGSFRIWDAKTAQLRHELPHPVRWSSHPVATLGRIGNTDVVITWYATIMELADNSIRIWDAVTGRLRTTLPISEDLCIAAIGSVGDAVALVATPRLANRNRGLPLYILDAQTGDLRTELTVQDRSVNVATMAIGRIGGTDVVVAGSSHGVTYVWDAETGERRVKLQADPSPGSREPAVVAAVALGRVGGTDVVVAASDKTRIWDAKTGQLRATLNDRHWTAFVTLGNVVGTDIVVTDSFDRSARIWDARTGQLRAALIGHSGWINAVAIGRADDIDMIVTGSEDRSARIWTIESGAVWDRPDGHDAWISSAAAGQLGKADIVVSGSRDCTVRVWDARTGILRNRLTGHNGWVNAVATGRVGNSDVVVSGSRDCTVRVWDARTGVVRNLLTGHDDWVNAVAIGYVGDSEVIVTASDDVILVWDAPTGGIRLVLDKPCSGITSIALGRARGDSVIVAGSRDGNVRVWDASSGVLRRTLSGHENWIRAVAVGQVDGTDVIVTASDDETARIWDARTGRLRTVLNGHNHWVHAVAIGRAGDQDIIVTGSWDKTARVWDAKTGTCRSVFHWHDDAITAVAIGRAGGQDIIITGSADRTMMAYVQLMDSSYRHPPAASVLDL